MRHFIHHQLTKGCLMEKLVKAFNLDRATALLRAERKFSQGLFLSFFLCFFIVVAFLYSFFC